MSEEKLIRINKYLSEAGFCSRRAADALVEEGRVAIDGECATTGSKVSESQIVTVDGQALSLKVEKKVYAFYKPVGYISSLSDEQGEGIGNLLKSAGVTERVYPVGRLDRESEGLLLLTNDGELMNTILRAANGHEKEYLVQVNRPISKEFIQQLQQGVEITNGATGERVTTAPCGVTKVSDRTFRIILKQGLNRQIRRMCGAFSYQVVSLKRERIVNVTLGEMKPGEIRELQGMESQNLYESIKEQV